MGIEVAMPPTTSLSNPNCLACGGRSFIEVAQSGWAEPTYRREPCDECFPLESVPCDALDDRCDVCLRGEPSAFVPGLGCLCEFCYGEARKGHPDLTVCDTVPCAAPDFSVAS